MSSQPDWDAINEALARNPKYRAASAEIEAAERKGPPEEVDVRALFRELRGEQITDEINADPEEIARLRKARQQAREGKLGPR